MACNFKIKLVDPVTNEEIVYMVENTGTDNTYSSFRKSLSDFVKSNEELAKSIFRIMKTSEDFPNINVVPNQAVGLYSPTDLINTLGKYSELGNLLKKLPIKKIKGKNLIFGYASENVPTGYSDGKLFVNLNFNYDKPNKIRALFELSVHDTFPDEYEQLINDLKSSDDINRRSDIIDLVLNGNEYKEQLKSIILNAYSSIDINSIFKSQEEVLDPKKLSVADTFVEYSKYNFDKDYEPQNYQSIYGLTQGDLIGVKIPGTHNIHYEIFYDYVEKEGGFAVRTLVDGELFRRTVNSESVIAKKVTNPIKIQQIDNSHGETLINVKVTKGHKLSNSNLYNLIKLGLVKDVIVKSGKDILKVDAKQLSGNIVKENETTDLDLNSVTHFDLILPTELSDNIENTDDYSQLSFARIGDIALLEQNGIKFNALIIGRTSDGTLLYVKKKDKSYTTGSTKHIDGILNIGTPISEFEENNINKTLENFKKITGKGENQKVSFREVPYSYSEGYPEMIITPGNILVQNGIKYKVLAVGRTIRLQMSSGDKIKLIDIKKSDLSKYELVGDFIINNTFATQNIWKNRWLVGDMKLENTEKIPCKVSMNPTTKFTYISPINEVVPNDLVDISDIYKTYLENKYKNKISQLNMYISKDPTLGIEKGWHVRNNAFTTYFKYSGESTFENYIVPGSYIRLKNDANEYIVERVVSNGFVISQYGFSGKVNPNTKNEDLKYIKQFTRILPTSLPDVKGVYIPNWANNNIQKLNDIVIKSGLKESIGLDNLSDNDSPELIYNMTKLISEKYGVNINIIGDADLSDFPELGNNANRVRAFVSNGEIYINIDKASIEEPLHELLHLVLGTIKAQDPNKYYNIINSIQGHPLYHDVSANYEEVNADVLEETFIRLLTKTFRHNIESDGIFNEVIFDKALKGAITELMDLQESIEEENPIKLLNTNVADILSDFGSSLIQNKEGIVNKDNAVLMLEVASTLRNLLKSKNLIQTC